MKKIIITENQAKSIKDFINEANNVGIDKFIKELISEFTKSLASVKVGDSIFFFFGTELDDGTWDVNTVTVLFFTVTEVNNEVIKIKFNNSKGKDLRLNNFKTKDFIISTKSLVFNNGSPLLSLGYIDDNKIKDIKFNNFLVLDVKVNKGATPQINVDAEVDEVYKKYSNLRNKLVGKIIYEPSLLGMNNFFFYPKGLIELNKIAQKYGVGIDNHEDDLLKFTLLTDNVPNYKEKGPNGEEISQLVTDGRYSGILDTDKKQVRIKDKVTEFIVQFNRTDIIVPGVEFLVMITVLVNGSEFDKETSRIKVTKI